MNLESHHKTPRQVALLAAIFCLLWTGVSPRAYGADSAACAVNPENRALDFWLGDWSVAAPGSAPNATSAVTLEQDRCVVVERWDGGRGHTGENLFAYSADDRGWRGMFTDNKGRVHVFSGMNVAHGAVEFTGPSSDEQRGNVLNRVTIRRISDTQVEQNWEKSSDGGKTWTSEFRGMYTRRQP